MTAIAQRTANHYTKMLLPLERSVKLAIISRLSASLLEDSESKKPDMSFFDGLTGAWDNGISPDDEAAALRSARVQGKTRVLESF